MFFSSKNTQLGYQADIHSLRLTVGQPDPYNKNTMRMVLFIDEKDQALVQILKQKRLYEDWEILQDPLKKTYRMDSNYFPFERRKLLFDTVENYLLKQNSETPILNLSLLEKRAVLMEGTCFTKSSDTLKPNQIIQCLNALRNIANIEATPPTPSALDTIPWTPIRLETMDYLNHLTPVPV